MKSHCREPGSSPDPNLLDDVISPLQDTPLHTCSRWAPSLGRGALQVLPLYTGRAGGYGLLFLAKTLRVRISLALVPLGCRGGWDYSVRVRNRKAGFLTTHPALWHWLQSGYQTPGNHFLLEWLMAALCTIWPNQGDLPASPAGWQMYAKLQQMLRGLSMKNAIFDQ